MNQVDNYYMNFAYLSEKWLLQYLRDSPLAQKDPHYRKHLADESRHTRLCYEALKKKSKYVIKESLEYSLQESLYRKANIIPAQILTYELHSALVYVIERRAAFLYKRYLSVGKDPDFLSLTKTLLDDEKEHISFHQSRSPLVVSLLEKDKLLFNKIGKIYSGDVISEAFWLDLFDNQLEEILIDVA